MPVIDMHAHAFPEKIMEKAVINLEEFYGLEIPNRGDLEGLLTAADEAGVEKIALHIAATKPSQVRQANDWIAAAVATYPDRLIGFGTVHPYYEDYKAELERMATLGLRGVKFHPELQNYVLDEERAMALYEAIGDRFIIMFHMGDERSHRSAPARLARVLETFPHLRVIAAHLGGYESWEEARKYLYGKNLYLDTSSALWCMKPEEAAELIRAHGVDKVFFGSDYPVATPGEELERLHALPLTEEEKEKILYTNALRLLRE
ncbi:MAG: uncharacterized protein PWQ31_512 [Eubacteriales bacterium]|nr:uncharacterized protein [Eubacteriales bacterium]